MAVSIKEESQPTTTQTSLENGSVDDAWLFLNKHQNDDLNTELVDIRRLRRKVDWRIVPLMFGCYTMLFLDKVILNVSQSLSMLHIVDLTVSSTQLSWAYRKTSVLLAMTFPTLRRFSSWACCASRYLTVCFGRANSSA